MHGHDGSSAHPTRATRATRAAIVLAVLLATMLSLVPLQATAASAASDGEAVTFLDELNILRAQVGAPPLAICPTLMTATQLHADDVSLLEPRMRPFGLGASWGADGKRSWNISAGEGGACTVNPVGGLEVVSAGYGTLRVAGWALDPNTSAPIAVHVYAGSTGVGAVTNNRSRSDIAGLYLSRGGNYGFDTTLEAPSGTSDVCVIAINVGLGGNHQLGCRRVTVTDPTPFGDIDAVTSPAKGQLRVGGWAIDPDAGVGPIEIRRYGPASAPTWARPASPGGTWPPPTRPSAAITGST